MTFSCIRIVEPAGSAITDALERNVGMLRDAGFKVLFESATHCNGTPMSAAPDIDRAHALQHALMEPNSDVVIAARGGYGASSILDLLDWSELANAPAKPVVGFSDISALHSALLTLLGRAGLHAPMPGSPLFGQHDDDIDHLMILLKQGLPWRGGFSITPHTTTNNEINEGPRDPDVVIGDPDVVISDPDVGVSGWLFGGNLATLSALIGTPYFPSSLHGAIVCLEDVGEHAGRLGRYFTQWMSSGAMNGVRALVLGEFTESGEGNAGNRDNIVNEFVRRVDCPVYTTDAFGHVSPNAAMATGATVTIRGNRLVWQLDSLTPFAGR